MSRSNKRDWNELNIFSIILNETIIIIIIKSSFDTLVDNSMNLRCMYLLLNRHLLCLLNFIQSSYIGSFKSSVL